MVHMHMIGMYHDGTHAHDQHISRQCTSLHDSNISLTESCLVFVLTAIFPQSLKVKGSIIISIVLATFIGINYYGLHVYGDGDSKFLTYLFFYFHPLFCTINNNNLLALIKLPSMHNAFNSFAVRCHSTDPNTKCVTKLSAWNNPTGSTFIVDMHNIPSGKLTFEYANKPFFWECVWTFLFVELFDSFGTLTGIMTRAGFMKVGSCRGGVSSFTCLFSQRRLNFAPVFHSSAL